MLVMVLLDSPCYKNEHQVVSLIVKSYIMGLQEEEDCSNTNWEWRNKIVKTHYLPKHSLPKP